MTLGDRVAAVAAYGFSTRQAAFLTTVMLHAGVCVPRQYTQFAGIGFGRTTRDLFARLIDDRFATAHPCWRGAARLYHIHHKGLYRAIGEPNNRHRRPTTLGRALERLMVLDTVLAAPEITWLATEREKVTFFVHQRGVAASELPAMTFERGGSRTVRYFAEKLPIGLVPNSNDVLFVYLATEPEGLGLRRFLMDHRPLLQRLPRWILRVVFPSSLATAQGAHRSTLAALCAAPLRPSVVDEFRWFCRARQLVEIQPPQSISVDHERYARARRAFGAPRFYAVYRACLRQGEAAFTELLSPRLHDAWQRGEIRFENHVLPYQYQHLVPAVATA